MDSNEQFRSRAGSVVPVAGPYGGAESALIASIDCALVDEIQVASRATVTKKAFLGDTVYVANKRRLVIHFFAAEALLLPPTEALDADVLRARGVVHAGYFEMQGSKFDRYGWNVVLMRDELNSTFSWLIVETSLKPAIAGLETRPFVTEAHALARNLSRLWSGENTQFHINEQPLREPQLVDVLRNLIS